MNQRNKEKAVKLEEEDEAAITSDPSANYANTSVVEKDKDLDQKKDQIVPTEDNLLDTAVAPVQTGGVSLVPLSEDDKGRVSSQSIERHTRRRLRTGK